MANTTSTMAHASEAEENGTKLFKQWYRKVSIVLRVISITGLITYLAGLAFGIW